MALSLGGYTARAIEQGVRGRQNALAFESAGYTRRIAFRQTDSPTASAAYSKTRGETTTPASGRTLTDAYQSSLTLNENLPTGTVASVAGKYDASDKPSVTATLTQPLYLFVKNPALRTRRKASLAYESSQDSYEGELLAIRAQARSLYYDVMLQGEGIKVEQRKLSSSRALNDVTLALVQAGKLAPVESMRSKIRLQRDQRQLHNAEVQYEKAVLNAKSFITLPLEQPVQFTTELAFAPFTLSLERLSDYALLHQPRLKNLRRAQELSRIDFTQSREATRPTLSLTSTYGYATARSEVTRNWSLAGAANWTFFDSFITRDNVRIARVGETVADLNLAEGERVARLDVRNAYLDVKNAERQIVDFRAAREQARRNVEVLRIRFQQGLDRLIDVFDAENEARNIEFEYLNLLVNFNRTKDSLAQTIGGDLEKVP